MGTTSYAEPVSVPPAGEDEEVLRTAGIGTDATALKAYFEQRILQENVLQKAAELIRQLGDNDFDVREKATQGLIALGPSVAPLLRKETSASRDVEVIQRARECLAKVEKTSGPEMVSAAVRLLAHRKVEGATQLLLQYEPLIGDETVLDAYRAAFAKLAKIDGKPNPLLVKATESKNAQARALAKEALVTTETVDQATAKKYLNDTSALVKLRVALFLIEKNDKSMVPLLIDLLPDLGVDVGWEAESVLSRLAGKNAPQVYLEEERASRVKARDAWKQWWEKLKATVDLADLKKTPALRGWTLIAMMNNRGQGEVYEQDRSGKTRWKITGVNYPLDAQILPNNNVLVAEMSSSRVTERNPRTNKIVWQYAIPSVVACQRMPNGDTLVANYNQVKVISKNRKVRMTYTHQRGSLRTARKLANGEILVLTGSQELIRLSATGKLIKTFRVGRATTYTTIDILPNGNVLVPCYSQHQVIEYDKTGKQVWSASARYPTAAQRLPNGNTLVTSLTNRSVVELSRSGKSVKTTSVAGTPWHIHRR